VRWWWGEGEDGGGRGRGMREKEDGRGGSGRLTSDRFASLEAWISAICFSVRFLFVLASVLVEDGKVRRQRGIERRVSRSGRGGTYISLSINSNRPSTAITASVFSCFNSTGPTSL
jgi:hypothetical protein